MRSAIFKTSLLSMMLGLALLGYAQDASVPSPATPVSDLKISLMDGSIVTGKLSVSELTVETRFGTLKVPVDDIQSFVPGLQSHPTFAASLYRLTDNLAADAFADRESAQQALLKLGPEIRGELERLLKTAQAEKQNRLQKIMEEFETQLDDDEPNPAAQWVKDDVIVTPGFTVVGRIATPSFAVTTPFGSLQLKLEDVRRGWREAAGPEEIRRTIAINGTALSQRAFTNTGIRLAKGDQVSITATGTIQMTPWGDSQISTPDGSTNYGNMGGIPGGTLVGRIGDGGPIMRIGSKSSFTADRPGVLQFGVAVAGNYSSQQFPGEYQARVRVVKKK